MILALSSKSRLPLSRKGRERGEGDGYRGWGIREENSRAKAGARAISRRFSGARVSPRPGRATRCACARSIRCRSWRLIGRPLPDKSRSRSCRSERGRAAIRGLSARLFPRPPLQRRQSAYYHRLCLLFFPSLPRIYTIVSRTYIYRTRIYILHIHVIYRRGGRAKGIEKGSLRAGQWRSFHAVVRALMGGTCEDGEDCLHECFFFFFF